MVKGHECEYGQLQGLTARKLLRPADRIHQFHPLQIRAYQIEQGGGAEDQEARANLREAVELVIEANRSLAG